MGIDLMIEESIKRAFESYETRFKSLESEIVLLKSKNGIDNPLKIMTRKDVADYLGVNQNKVSSLVNAGKLVCYNNQGKCKKIFYLKDVISYLESLT